jgi:hypothetical protein
MEEQLKAAEESSGAAQAAAAAARDSCRELERKVQGLEKKLVRCQQE